MKLNRRTTGTRHKKPYYQYFISIPRKMKEKLGWEKDTPLISRVTEYKGKKRLILEVDEEAEVQNDPTR